MFKTNQEAACIYVSCHEVYTAVISTESLILKLELDDILSSHLASNQRSEYSKVNQNTGKLDRDAYKIPKFSKKYFVLFNYAKSSREDFLLMNFTVFVALLC